MEEAKERTREKMEDSTLDERGDRYEHDHDKTPAERANDEKIQAKEAGDATRHDDDRDRTEGRGGLFGAIGSVLESMKEKLTSLSEKWDMFCVLCLFVCFVFDRGFVLCRKGFVFVPALIEGF
ncbi:hypothetical protein Droror1_Dr00023852 [Drosera rotundifolia]